MAVEVLQGSQAATVLSNEPRTTNATQLLHRKFHWNDAEKVISYLFIGNTIDCNTFLFSFADATTA